MTELLTCTLVTPEKVVFSSEVDMVSAPGVEGDFGVMAEHVPFISMLRPGVVEFHRGGGLSLERIFISAGYLETHGTECTILAESAEPLSTLSRERVESELLNARKDLEYAKDGAEKTRAEIALAVAEARQAAAV